MPINLCGSPCAWERSAAVSLADDRIAFVTTGVIVAALLEVHEVGQPTRAVRASEAQVDQRHGAAALQARADRAEERADAAEHDREAERARADSLRDRLSIMQAQLVTAETTEARARRRPRDGAGVSWRGPFSGCSGKLTRR
jgi:hypothetical protein